MQWAVYLYSPIFYKKVYDKMSLNKDLQSIYNDLECNANDYMYFNVNVTMEYKPIRIKRKARPWKHKHIKER